MFALFGLIFLLIKIAILALIYSTVIFLFFLILSFTTNIAWIKKSMQHKLLFWFVTGFIISLTLLVYSFSYWGNHGLGDYARIPIGNGYEVSNIDGTSNYLEDKQNRQLFLKKFIVNEGKLCSEFQGFNSSGCIDCYVVFDPNEDKLFEFHSEQEYSNFAKDNNLPLRQDFKEYFENYQEYWGGLRAWLLP